MSASEHRGIIAAVIGLCMTLVLGACADGNGAQGGGTTTSIDPSDTSSSLPTSTTAPGGSSTSTTSSSSSTTAAPTTSVEPTSTTVAPPGTAPVPPTAPPPGGVTCSAFDDVSGYVDCIGELMSSIPPGIPDAATTRDLSRLSAAIRPDGGFAALTNFGCRDHSATLSLCAVTGRAVLPSGPPDLAHVFLVEVSYPSTGRRDGRPGAGRMSLDARRCSDSPYADVCASLVPGQGG